MARKTSPGGRSDGNTAYYRARSGSGRKKSGSYKKLSKKREKNVYILTVLLLAVLMAAVAALIAWGMYLGSISAPPNPDPTGNPTETTQQTQTEPTDSGTEGPAGPTGPVDIASIYDNYRGAYVDLTLLGNIQNEDGQIVAELKTKAEAELLSLTGKLKASGINAVMLDIKKENSHIPYDTVNMVARTSFVVWDKGLPIQRVIEILHGEGMYVSGRLVCFMDDVVAMTLPNYVLRMANEAGSRWADAGGRFWLNIYKNEPRKYVTDLAMEAAELGFDEIILSHFYVPDVNAKDVVFEDGGISKNEIVRKFAASLMIDLKAQYPHVRLGLEIPIEYFLRNPAAAIGVDAEALIPYSDFFTTGFTPTDVPSWVAVNGKPLANPYANLNGSVKALATHLAVFANNASHGFRPWLRASDHGSFAYGSVQVRQMLEALRDAGIGTYTLVASGNAY